MTPKKPTTKKQPPKPPKETAGCVDALSKEALKKRERKVERFEQNQGAIKALLIVVIVLQLIIIFR
jgi:hypothetical protein